MTEPTSRDRCQELFGLPNEHGAYLVGVIEFSDDADEDGWSYVGNYQMGMLASASQKLGYGRDDISIAEPYRHPGRGVLPDGTELAVTSIMVRGTPSWYRSSRQPTTDERLRRAGLPVPPPPPEPVPVGPNIETAKPRIEEHQGEVFYTKTGKPISYKTNRYTLEIVESRRSVQWYEVQSALEAWPISVHQRSRDVRSDPDGTSTASSRTNASGEVTGSRVPRLVLERQWNVRPPAGLMPRLSTGGMRAMPQGVGSGGRRLTLGAATPGWDAGIQPDAQAGAGTSLGEEVRRGDCCGDRT